MFQQPGRNIPKRNIYIWPVPMYYGSGP